MRPLSLKIASLLAAMFLFNFSCQDHVVPENPQPEEIAPVIKTTGISVEDLAANLYRLKTQFLNLGNKPIIEYGVVYSIEPDNGSQNFTSTPTIADSKSTFSLISTLLERIHITEINLSGAKQLYYRAYAIYGNNKVVYGEILVYDPRLAIMEAVFEAPLSKPYQTAYELQDLGKTPIDEYGVVYSYKTQANGNINSFPTIADNKVVAPGSPATIIGLGGANLPIVENSVFEIYVRTYVKYTNGHIQYGNSILHGK